MTTLIDQNKLKGIIAAAIRDTRIDYPAIEPGVSHESIPFAEAVLAALDKAGLMIVPKGSARRERSSDPKQD